MKNNLENNTIIHQPLADSKPDSSPPYHKGGGFLRQFLIKGDRTPEEAGLSLIKQPNKPPSNRLLIDTSLDYPKSWDNFVRKNK